MVQKIVMVALAVVFVLLIINIGTSFYFYKQYKDNISYFDQQNWLTRVKLENIEKNMDGYKNTVESLNTQFNSYAENLSVVDKRVAAGESEKKDIIAKMDGIKSDIQGWQKNYNNIISEIKERTEILKANLEQLAKGLTEQVNLGKISVKNEGEGAAPASGAAAGTEKEKPASGADNFGPRE